MKPGSPSEVSSCYALSVAPLDGSKCSCARVLTSSPTVSDRLTSKPTFVHQLWVGNGKRDKMIVGRQSGREGQFDVDRVGREAANEAAVCPCVQIMNLDNAVLLRPEVLRASALRSAF